MATKTQKVSLENIVKEKLRKQILSQIDTIDIEVLEIVEPGFSLKIGKKSVEFRLMIRTSTKKFVAWVGGLAATIGGVITFLKWFIPILVAHFSKAPP